MNFRPIAIWILRLGPAIILLQTLYFKFTAHPESVKLFTYAVITFICCAILIFIYKERLENQLKKK